MEFPPTTSKIMVGVLSINLICDGERGGRHTQKKKRLIGLLPSNALMKALLAFFSIVFFLISFTLRLGNVIAFAIAWTKNVSTAGQLFHIGWSTHCPSKTKISLNENVNGQITFHSVPVCAISFCLQILYVFSLLLLSVDRKAYFCVYIAGCITDRV